jgi:hypothetical protein
VAARAQPRAECWHHRQHSVRTTRVGGVRGYDGVKRLDGRKRHMASRCSSGGVLRSFGIRHAARCVGTTRPA